MTPEERIKAAILEYQANTERRMTEMMDAGKVGLATWVKDVLDGLAVVMPIGVKPILDAGGAIRQVILDCQAADSSCYSRPVFQCHAFHDQKELSFSDLAPSPRFRVTVIVEPLPAETKKR